MIRILGGINEIGTNEKHGFSDDKEGPSTMVNVNDFYIDETTVTNEAFQEFVNETGYITEAEKFGWSFVFHYFLTDEQKSQSKKVKSISGWLAVKDAYWKSPEGFSSTIDDRLDHPVVHISRNDAIAYCKWSGKRLPTEAEWEIAAKGNIKSELYPWGDELLKEGKINCNIWQGNFPFQNTLEDGYAGTAPVKTFTPNEFGLYQMIGNVWEWCVNPKGIPLSEFNYFDGQDYWKAYQNIDDEKYAIKGGSFLCHQSYCKRYRIAARNGNTGRSTSNNLGFRCVKDIDLPH
ncbi:MULTISPECIES: formylglycine-generating enzyme family protein [unclassified Virgibacillus]|uniref:formylglycine-generating enzyme family protein n=1 Tax=unclassified Virgibacillus TaxID=2620237 RepID=UPI00090C0E08|nr:MULTISPECIES: formylglycine-generating enzyme family protein [unclassified Virgibacillus]API91488.1 serine/threonine protein phosphatase [Virgibacillus sp. 6R]MBS7427004.1 formylglycine-generating enzyme family protein [Virgibacillus sp. 19R1-5]